MRRDGLHAEAEVAAHLLLDLGLHVRELADGARQLADGHGLAGAPQPLEVPPGLHVPDGDLQPERRGFGVHAVGAADDQRVLVPHGEHAQRAAQPLLPLQEEVDRVAQLQRGGRVPDVAGGEPDVHVARVVAELLLEAGEERDHLVLDPLLDGQDAVHVDAQRADPRHDLGGDAAPARVGFAGRDFHPEPRLVLCGLAPDTSHGGPGVPLDHAVTLPEMPEEW